MKNKGLNNKGNQNKQKKEIKGMGKKDNNKKQEQKKPAVAAPATAAKPECTKCGRKYLGEFEERKCDYCYADPAPDRQKVKNTHFTKQCSYKFPKKAPLILEKTSTSPRSGERSWHQRNRSWKKG